MSEYSSKTSFIDLAAQQKTIRPIIENAIDQVLKHGQYIMGPEVIEFESLLREFTKSKYAITCANGTDALQISLLALDIGKEDIVFVPSFNYVAAAEAIVSVGAIPYFVDVDESTFNIDTKSLKKALINCKRKSLTPKLIISVDLFGLPSVNEELLDVARQENIKIIFDAAQSLGSSSDEINTGNFGEITTTSFFPAKPLGCYGDGGAIFTNSEDLYEKITSIRLHGRGKEKYEHVRLGMNSRLDTIQAAILIQKLKIFPDEIIKRNKVANKYIELINKEIICPETTHGKNSVWAQFTIKYKERDKLKSFLATKNIPSVIYYPKPLHMQPAYSHYYGHDDCYVSEDLSKKVLSLPMHPYLNEKNQLLIIDSINEFIG